jgi:hypothetical protein
MILQIMMAWREAFALLDPPPYQRLILRKRARPTTMPCEACRQGDSAKVLRRQHRSAVAE